MKDHLEWFIAGRNIEGTMSLSSNSCCQHSHSLCMEVAHETSPNALSFQWKLTQNATSWTPISDVDSNHGLGFMGLWSKEHIQESASQRSTAWKLRKSSIAKQHSYCGSFTLGYECLKWNHLGNCRHLGQGCQKGSGASTEAGMPRPPPFEEESSSLLPLLV